MTPCVAHRYTLEEIRQIDVENPDLKVSTKVLEILKLIETQIVIPQEDVVVPSSSSISSNHNHNNHKLTDRFSDRRSSLNTRRKPAPLGRGGQAAVPFQATKRVEVSTLDKQFNDVRAMLNKLSSKNVDTQKSVVTDAIAKFLFQIEEEEEQQDTKIQHVRKITEILISNPFLVKVYVDIYADLCSSKFPYHTDFTTMVRDTLVQEYAVSFRELQAIVESTDDYDAFCEYNKRNDKRKAWATFFAEASKQKVVVAPSQIQQMIQELLELVHQNLVKENKTHEVEEWTENISVLVLNSGLQQDPIIQGSMRDLTQKKTKDFPSWSSRALFKYMDLVKLT